MEIRFRGVKELNIITENPVILFVNWDKRQFTSDSSKERVKRYREKKRNVTVTPDVTPPEQSREQRQSRAYSSELKEDSSKQPPIISIPLINKTEYPIYQTDITEWQDSYPAVDILQALRALRQWNISNPKRQKTPGGIRRHITGWLDKEQNKGGQQQPKYDPVTNHNMGVVSRFLRKEGAA